MELCIGLEGLRRVASNRCRICPLLEDGEFHILDEQGSRPQSRACDDGTEQSPTHRILLFFGGHRHCP